MFLVTGANGLTGRYILPELAREYPSQKIHALVRSREKGDSLYPHIDNYVVGDLTDLDAVKRALNSEIEIIIHIAGIRYSLNVIKEAKKHLNNLRQIIFVHTTGMYSRYRDCSGLYQQIENTLIPQLKYSGIPFTILRPTMIYGSVTDKNMNKLIHYLATKKFFPLFGHHGKMQPIFYQDLGKAILSAIDNKVSFDKGYNLSGKTVLTYGEIVRIVKAQLNSKTILVPIPYFMALMAGWVYEKVSKSPKISLEQIRRLSEDKVFDHSSASKDLGFDPISFEKGIRYEIDEYLCQKNKFS